jgi:hypothetical protein
MKRNTRFRHLGAVVAASLLALALPPPLAHAEQVPGEVRTQAIGDVRDLGPLAVGGENDLFVVLEERDRVEGQVTRTGNEPWYRQANADVRTRARDLFTQALDKHQQLFRGDAAELYDQALALWDNPDIRWNLALVLEDLGKYLRAYQQLDGALRWGEALGAERLRGVRERMQKLEAERLARIEAACDEPGAEIRLDGDPWFRGAGRKTMLVEPGEHYLAARKPGFFPVIRSVSVNAGQVARVAFPMDADHALETRRWSAWKPWVAVTAGAVVTAVGAGLERQAIMRRDAAAKLLPDTCGSARGCTPTMSPTDYDRAVRNHRIAIGAFAVGGATLAVGLTMAWMNQVHVHRTEARAPGPIEVVPILSTDQVGVSAGLRF